MRARNDSRDRRYLMELIMSAENDKQILVSRMAQDTCTSQTVPTTYCTCCTVLPYRSCTVPLIR